MKRKIFYKLLISYLVIVALSFLVMSLFIRSELQEVLTGKIERELLAYARLIDLKSADAVTAQMARVASISSARVTLIDADGSVLSDSLLDAASLDNHLNRPELQEARVRGTGTATRFSQSDQSDMLYVAVTVRDASGHEGYVRLSRNLSDVKKTIDDVYGSFFIALTITTVVALILAVLFAYYLTRPIRSLERFTERLRRGDPSGVLLLSTSDETRKLADNINYLVEELQSKIRLANEEKSKLMTALTSINEGVLILRPDERIEFVSPSLATMLAGRYGEITGKTLMEAFRSVDLQKAFTAFKDNRSLITREITLGGVSPVILGVSISNVQGPPGQEKIMVVFHDVTRLKKLEQIRTDFVANVTHEIRTPLTAVIGYLETLQSGAIHDTEEALRFVDIMHKQALRLNRLVEDLMTISKIELGEVAFRMEPVSLADIVAGVIPILDKRISDKRITLVNQLPELNLPEVRGDRDRLVQVFVNILDNAVKFTPEGGQVTIASEQSQDGVTVMIRDTGAGIPKEEIQRLGERFYRVDKTRSRELGGTGLGLSIVKHLMQAHGGRMEIESRLGQGATVLLWFPRSKA